MLPGLLPLVFGGQLGSAVATVAANLVIVAVIYAVFVYGLLAILRWVATRLASQLASSLSLLATAVPLLAIFALLFASLVVAGFFVLFGLLAIDEAAREAWIGGPGDVLVSISLGGDTFELTSELPRVAGGLAAFSGFYFAVAMLTDSTYRDEFLSELTDEMRVSFRARAEYLRLRGAER